jgi:hypothetical protein
VAGLEDNRDVVLSRVSKCDNEDDLVSATVFVCQTRKRLEKLCNFAASVRLCRRSAALFVEIRFLKFFYFK